MKIKILLLICLTSIVNIYSQDSSVGVGIAIPDQSAIMHVYSQDKGLIIPNIALKSFSDQETIKNPSESLLIYNITDDRENSGLFPGYYYWDVDKTDSSKSRWTRILRDSEVRDYETLTSFHVENMYEFIYTRQDENGDVENRTETKIQNGDEEVIAPDLSSEGFNLIETKVYKSLVYQDEHLELSEFKLTDIMKDSELPKTSFIFNPSVSRTLGSGETKQEPALVYTDLEGDKQVVFISDFLVNNETITSLVLDGDELLYTDEEHNENKIDISQIIPHVWIKMGGDNSKVVYGDNIQTKGWVGIGEGLTLPEPGSSEMLQVKGSITAVNSYYADYVFDAYFEGESKLKEDYSFNNLEAIENFIKTNRHLPGVKPINELIKSDNGYSFNLSELSVQLLEKTEELYLHTIDQAKQIKDLQELTKDLSKLREENADLKNQINEILLQLSRLNLNK